MPLFKAFKALNATVSISTSKDQYALGETVEGEVLVASGEDFAAKEIRLELCGVERARMEGEAAEEEVEESAETRFYSPQDSYTERGDTIEYPMHDEKIVLGGASAIRPGASERFPFRILIPAESGPTFTGMRKDGQRLEREWTLRARVVVGGRSDLEARKEIRAVFAPTQGAAALSPQPDSVGTSTVCQYCGALIPQGAATCNSCGGRQASS